MFTEVIAFAGPSLAIPTTSRLVRPHRPAKRGDLRPFRGQTESLIVLVDGLFFHNGAITHTEILDVLNSGCAMIGAASMGALRAAELRHAGLFGVGTAYQALLQGYVVDDSEFAVGVCPYTYRATTISLLDIRGVLGKMAAVEGQRAELREAFDIAQNIHFLDRTFARLSKAWSDSCTGCGAALVSALANRDGFIKENDAKYAIRIAEACLSKAEESIGLSALADQHPKVPIFHVSGVCQA